MEEVSRRTDILSRCHRSEAMRDSSELSVLDGRALVAFAAACAERLYPVYVRFALKSGGKDNGVRSSLDAVWEWLEGGHAVRAGLYSECEQCLPDSDDPDDDAGYAEYAVIALMNLVSLCQSPTVAFAQRVTVAVQDLLDSWLEATLFAPDSDLKAMQSLRGRSPSEILEVMQQRHALADQAKERHPAYQAEDRRQLEDIRLLRGQPGPDWLAVLRALRERSSATPVIPDR
jgi:hypothetical protein